VALLIRYHHATNARLRSAPARAARPAALALLLLTALPACGHPASRDECEEIFQRSAEIELRAQNVNDPNTIAERIKEARAARGDDLMNQCVGKRITNEAVACVRKASTSEQVDRCLD
jgi:hypothetical protein